MLVAGQLLVALLSSGAAAEGEQASPRALADAQQYLVEHFGGRPTDYELLAERETIAGTMPMWSGKFVDTRTGEVRLVYRDAAGVVGAPNSAEYASPRSWMHSRPSSARLHRASCKP